MDENIEKNIRENLIALRKSKNLKQTDLANLIGYSDKTISRWENGTSIPDVVSLVNIAEFYNISIQNILKKDAVIASSTEMQKKNKEILGNKFAIFFMEIISIYTIAIIVFFSLVVIKNINYWQVYVLALIPSSLLFNYFNRKVLKNKWVHFISLSLLVLSTITSAYLCLLQYNVWFVFILIAPIEALILVSTFLRKK